MFYMFLDWVVAPCGFEPQSQGPGPYMITATLGGYDVMLCIFGEPTVLIIFSVY